MRVKNVYDVSRYPRHYVVELLDGSFAIFAIAPYRQIAEADLSPLAITSIDQIATKPYILPGYELRGYGIEIV